MYSDTIDISNEKCIFSHHESIEYTHQSYRKKENERQREKKKKQIGRRGYVDRKEQTINIVTMWRW